MANDEDDEREESEEYEEDSDEEDLVEIIEDDTPGGFVPHSSFEAPSPTLEQTEPVEHLDDLQQEPSQRAPEEEAIGHADYAGVHEDYSSVAGGGADYQQHGYFDQTAQNEMSPRRGFDTQMDTTGGALRTDERAIREDFGGDTQRNVNMARWQQAQGDMPRQSRDYVGTPGRESDVRDDGLPFQRKERRRF
jgi:hypothetical protein